MQEMIVNIPLGQLVPRADQPRQWFNPEGISELADSMRIKGFLRGNAITVRPLKNNLYEILAGHRRTRAAKLAHLEEIPAIITYLTDAEAREFCLLDNLNREDFLCFEEGAGYAELIENGLPVEVVASKAGKSVAYVRGRIHIHENAGEVAKELHIKGEIKLQVLQVLCELPDEDLSPCRCHLCGVVNGDGIGICAGCGASLGEEIRVTGNPQAAAAKLCKNKPNGAALEIVGKVKDSYGIGEEPVQASLALSFDDERLSPEAVAVRSALERRLAQITTALHHILKNGKVIRKLSVNAKTAIHQQCEVGIRALKQIQRIVE